MRQSLFLESLGFQTLNEEVRDRFARRYNSITGFEFILHHARLRNVVLQYYVVTGDGRIFCRSSSRGDRLFEHPGFVP